MSIKLRSAIGVAGHEGDGHLARRTRRLGDVDRVHEDPDAWSGRLRQGNPITRDAGKVWERTLLANRYQGLDDGGAGEGKPNGWSTTFPHPLGPAGDAAVICSLGAITVCQRLSARWRKRL